MSKNAVIIGAGSGLGRALAERLASENINLYLVSRYKRDLSSVSSDINNRFDVNCRFGAFDILKEDFDSNDIVQSSIKDLKKIDYLFITVGYVNNEDKGLNPTNELIDTIIISNYASIVKIISSYTKYFEKIKTGKIVAISSVAAGSPRRNNIIYSSSKLALEAYCRGLQHYLSGSNINIQLYRLGYMDTSMSFGHKLLFPAVKPSKVANRIVNNLSKNMRYF